MLPCEKKIRMRNYEIEFYLPDGDQFVGERKTNLFFAVEMFENSEFAKINKIKDEKTFIIDL
jgi:hypothetical protein